MNVLVHSLAFQNSLYVQGTLKVVNAPLQLILVELIRVVIKMGVLAPSPVLRHIFNAQGIL